MGGAGAVGAIFSMAGSLAGAGTRADAERMAAKARARGDRFQARQEQEMYYQGMTKSFQTDTAMTQHLTSTLANIAAVRASSGSEITSPTGDAVENRTLALGNQDIARTTRNIQKEAEKHREAAYYYLNAADDAMVAGGIAAQGAMMGGIGGAMGAIGGIFG